MKMKKHVLLFPVAVTLLLSGCMGLGVEKMSAEQIKATNGMAFCTNIFTMYGRGVSSSINVDDVRKGATAKGGIKITKDCDIEVTTDVGVAGVPGAMTTTTIPATTTTTVVPK